jgi:hypothetical protein
LAAAGRAATPPERDSKQRADAHVERFALTMAGLKTRDKGAVLGYMARSIGVRPTIYMLEV